MKRFHRWFLGGVFLALAAGRSLAADLNGEEILRRAADRKTPKTSVTRFVMKLVDKKGQERSREVLMLRKEDEKGSRSVGIILAPPDDKGLAVLQIDEPGKHSVQYLYQPAYQRLREVPPSDKKSRFLGSDFTYEDMQKPHVEDGRHKLLREEPLDGQPCYVVESRPNEEAGSQYAKIVQWIRKDNFVPVQAELYDPEGPLVKRLKVEGLKENEGYWTAETTEMADLRKGSRTDLVLKEVRYDSPLAEETFTERFLKSERYLRVR